MSNETFARAMTSAETYERVIRLYWRRRHSEVVRSFLPTWLRQARLKRNGL